MKHDNSGLYVLTIVAIVAIVGLITLFLNSGPEMVTLGDENVAGQAFSYGGIAIPGYSQPISSGGYKEIAIPMYYK